MYISIAAGIGSSTSSSIGAGGGGFLMFMADNKSKLSKALSNVGLQEVRFRFDFEGTKLMISE